jgi:hypothetical protein
MYGLAHLWQELQNMLIKLQYEYQLTETGGIDEIDTQDYESHAIISNKMVLLLDVYFIAYRQQ